MAHRTPAKDVTPEEAAAGFYKDGGAIAALVGINSLRAVKTINELSGAVEYVIFDARGDAVVIMDTLAQLTDFFPRR